MTTSPCADAYNVAVQHWSGLPAEAWTELPEGSFDYDLSSTTTSLYGINDCNITDTPDNVLTPTDEQFYIGNEYYSDELDSQLPWYYNDATPPRFTTTGSSYPARCLGSFAFQQGARLLANITVPWETATVSNFSANGCYRSGQSETARLAGVVPGLGGSRFESKRIETLAAEYATSRTSPETISTGGGADYSTYYSNYYGPSYYSGRGGTSRSGSYRGLLAATRQETAEVECALDPPP